MRSTSWINFLERVLWTLVQAASAEGIILAFEYLRGPIADPALKGFVLVGLTTLLAAVKNALAQSLGSPTGAMLPVQSRPVPAEQVVVQRSGTVDVAAAASPLTTGTLVSVVPQYGPSSELKRLGEGGA